MIWQDARKRLRIASSAHPPRIVPLNTNCALLLVSIAAARLLATPEATPDRIHAGLRECGS